MPAKPPTPEQFQLVADARAMGAGWGSAAETVNRSQETVRKWPKVYPDQWAAALIQAERGHRRQVVTEVIGILRARSREAGAEGLKASIALLKLMPKDELRNDGDEFDIRVMTEKQVFEACRDRGGGQGGNIFAASVCGLIIQWFREMDEAAGIVRVDLSDKP